MLQPIEAAAAQKVSSLKQMEKVFKQSIKKGEIQLLLCRLTVIQRLRFKMGCKVWLKAKADFWMAVFRSPERWIVPEDIITKLICPMMDALIKAKILKSKPAAKAAAKALKSGKYSTNFYSDESYYDVFRRLLQQHPEYNYDTSVWRSSNGA